MRELVGEVSVEVGAIGVGVVAVVGGFGCALVDVAVAVLWVSLLVFHSRLDGTAVWAVALGAGLGHGWLLSCHAFVYLRFLRVREN